MRSPPAAHSKVSPADEWSCSSRGFPTSARPPPYEAALPSEALLRKRGIRATVEVYTPEPSPMPVAGAEVGAAVRQILEQRGIGLHPEQTVEQIDRGRTRTRSRSRRARAVRPAARRPAPPRPFPRARGPVRQETGFVPANPVTLATAVDGVYAIGDVTAIPIAGGTFLPKAGVSANRQADVVAAHIATELHGAIPSAGFDGAAAYASGNVYGEPGPTIRLRRPGRHWRLAMTAVEQYFLRRWLR